MDGQDHDLLVALHEQVKQVRIDIKDLKDNITHRVEKLELEKLNREEALRLKNEADEIHKNFSTRLIWLERIAYISLGLLWALQFYFNFLRT